MLGWAPLGSMWQITLAEMKQNMHCKPGSDACLHSISWCILPLLGHLLLLHICSPYTGGKVVDDRLPAWYTKEERPSLTLWLGGTFQEKVLISYSWVLCPILWLISVHSLGHWLWLREGILESHGMRKESFCSGKRGTGQRRESWPL